jgi:hypothetical protein
MDAPSRGLFSWQPRRRKVGVNATKPHDQSTGLNREAATLRAYGYKIEHIPTNQPCNPPGLWFSAQALSSSGVISPSLR